MNFEDEEMRLPEEGAPTGAGPGTGIYASGQRSRGSRRLGRENPEIQSEIQRRQTTTSAPPAESAVQDNNELTQAGLPRRRIKWTREMNESVLRAYYMATRNENLTSYRQQMYTIFMQENPHLSQLTQQNLADRRAAIFRENLIPPALREEIRLRVIGQQIQHPTEAIQECLNTPPQRPTPMILHNNTMASQNLEANPPGQDTAIEAEVDNIAIVREIFNETKIKFMEMDARFRPTLKKHKPGRKMYHITSIIDREILPAEITPQSNYNHVVGLAYCSAYTITELLKPNRHTPEATENSVRNYQRPVRRNTRPGWQRRLQLKIDNLRKDLGFLTGYNTNRTGRKTNRKLLDIKRRHSVHTQFDPLNREIEELRDTVRQKLTKYAERMRNYMKSYERSRHNRLFQKEEKRFYNMIGRPNDYSKAQIDISISEIEEFWMGIWGKAEVHNHASIWLNELRQSMANNARMTTAIITNDVFKKAIGKLHNWKQPGVDKVHNYYYKYLTSLHGQMINVFNDLITNPDHILPEMCLGVTYLKQKVDNPVSASQFRPITCLNTGYKIFTSCIAIIIGKFCEDNNILAEEQKGCRQGTKGCKDQLIIDGVMTKQAIRNKRNIYTAFVDYQKAFDSVPHSWLTEVLEIYKIDTGLIDCIKGLMKFWQTTLHIRSGNNNIISKPINIQRGIYQGDSLSPLMFCIALNPLSLLLNQSQYGYKLSSDPYRFSHCFYMDDLKLYASKKSHRDSLLRIVEMFSNDIKMKFGIDKCRTQNVTRGKHTTAEIFTTTDNEQITPLLNGEHYKYLGIMQHIHIDNRKQKEDIYKEFRNRINKVCRSKLNGRNLVKAINTYAISLLTYTFGIIAWSDTELNNMDTKIRTTLTKNKYHHPRASIERINIPRKLGGRGIINIKMLHDNQKGSLVKYFRAKAINSELYREVVNADDNITPLDLRNTANNQPVTTENLMRAWKSKALHGKYPSMIAEPHVDGTITNNWLMYGNIFAETEGFIMAIQDGVIHTRNYRRYIIHDPTVADDSCRRCGSTPETIPHILNSCSTLLQCHYKQRHDNVGKIVYINIIKHLGINEPTTYYFRYHPKPIVENNRYIIYWDRTILLNTPVDTTIPNRPDMLIIDKQMKIAQIIDFAIPYDHNIQETIATKKNKYIQLSQYIKNTRNLVRVDIIPIVISSLGTIPVDTRIAMERLKLSMKVLTEMQKSVLIRAATIMRETIQ